MHYLNYITYFTLLAILHFSTLLAAQDCQNPIGKWQNDNGSVLEILSIDTAGLIRAKYRSHEGTTGQSFQVTGWWQTASSRNNHNVLSFSVYWKPYQTITSWTGYCHSKDNTIYTLWHHINPTVKYDFQKWSTQSSEFKPFDP